MLEVIQDSSQKYCLTFCTPFTLTLFLQECLFIALLIWGLSME